MILNLSQECGVILQDEGEQREVTQRESYARLTATNDALLTLSRAILAIRFPFESEDDRVRYTIQECHHQRRIS